MTTQLDCGHEPTVDTVPSTGYGIAPDGSRHCYDCCAKRERESMTETGRAVLYDCGTELTDWPGKLRVKVHERRTGRHNIAGRRYDVWFSANGAQWHGVRYGDNTQLTHCKRIAS